MYSPSCTYLASAVSCFCMLSGCAGLNFVVDHRPGEHTIQTVALESQPSESQVEIGQERPLVDGVGWIVGIPQKIILWNQRVDNHDISPETREKISQHLSYYGLQDTKVRINQYDPVGEWQRLRDNKNMHPGWKYTMGTLHTLGYTVLPGRIFGNDNYNPYTNTVNVYSDVPSIGMAETAYAYDIKTRDNPGLYAFSQDFPLLNMWHHNAATDRTVAYFEKYGSSAELKEAYHVLYPRYGSNFGNGLGSYVGGSTVLELGGALAGHAYGRYESSKVDPYKIAQSAPVQQENFEYAAQPAQTSGNVSQVSHSEQLETK